MQRVSSARMWHICTAASEGRGSAGPSENLDLPLGDEVPDFVTKAVSLGYEPAAAWALYRKILRTGMDIRKRRITPAGGVQRVERLALTVALVGGRS